MSYPRREGENLYDRFGDWFACGPVFNFRGPVLVMMPALIGGFLLQVVLMAVYGFFRLFLPRRWCP